MGDHYLIGNIVAYTYTTINGRRVETNVAAAFEKLRAAFQAQFGLDLLVSDGTRTRAEQQRLYDLYRAGKGNLAARPGQSNHEESGPRGPRALDVRDSGKDAGVTRSGTVRGNWMKANAPAYGFDPAGYRFSKIEPWHIEFTGKVGADVAPAPAPTPAPAVKGTLQGLRWYGIQKMLKKDFGYRGAIDNIPGKGSISSFQRFMNRKGYAKRALGHNIAEDGIDGKQTLLAAQQWLKETGRYSGSVDGIRGPGTEAGWQRAETENWKAYK